jgi:hypothetical protein
VVSASTIVYLEPDDGALCTIGKFVLKTQVLHRGKDESH